ncbi:MAG: hypothetical protein ACKOQO_01960, partial [Candidatus Limnocylindrus sp.]
PPPRPLACHHGDRRWWYPYPITNSGSEPDANTIAITITKRVIKSHTGFFGNNYPEAYGNAL